MVGRVIGKGGETIKALQQYTGAMIQIDQSTDPTRVTIAGTPQSLKLATAMVNDIVCGNFKGFAMLRQLTSGKGPQLPPGYEHLGQPQPRYVEGYGFVPPTQYTTAEDFANALLQSAATTLTGQAPPAAAYAPAPAYPSLTPMYQQPVPMAAHQGMLSQMQNVQQMQALCMVQMQNQPATSWDFSGLGPDTSGMPAGKSSPLLSSIIAPEKSEALEMVGTHSLFSAPIGRRELEGGAQAAGSTASPRGHPMPEVAGSKEGSESGLPEGWVAMTDPDGRSFWYNVLTRQSTWEVPTAP